MGIRRVGGPTPGAGRPGWLQSVVRHGLSGKIAGWGDRRGVVVANVVTNKEGYVYSPFVEGAKMVDVRKFSAGQQAHCPYTMRRFIVPGEATVAAPSADSNLRLAPRPEAPAERGLGRGRLVVATPVSDKSGYVYSPHAEEKRRVDVRKFRAGEEVLCPYTMRRFVVPDEGLVRINVEKLEREQTEQNPGRRLALMELPMVASAGRDLPSSLGVTRPPATEDSARVQRSRDEVFKTGSPESPGVVRTLPVGERVVGRPGFVVTPHGKGYQLVDVTGIAPGTEVKCPYTGKNFMVPGLGSAPSEGSSKPVPQTGGKPEAAPEPEGSGIPTAAWSGDSPGYVQSPFGKDGQLVDVTGFPAGTVVECPFSRKEFRVPQAKGGE